MEGIQRNLYVALYQMVIGVFMVIFIVGNYKLNIYYIMYVTKRNGCV